MKFKFEPRQLFCPSCQKPMMSNGSSNLQYRCIQPDCKRQGKVVDLPEIEIKES